MKTNPHTQISTHLLIPRGIKELCHVDDIEIGTQVGGPSCRFVRCLLAFRIPKLKINLLSSYLKILHLKGSSSLIPFQHYQRSMMMKVMAFGFAPLSYPFKNAQHHHRFCVAAEQHKISISFNVQHEDHKRVDVNIIYSLNSKQQSNDVQEI